VPTKFWARDRNKMKTDYKNLSLFEIAAVSMIAVGIALVGFQVFISLPDTAQAKVTSALQVLEMSTPAQEVWQIQTSANDLVAQGTARIYSEVLIAIGEIAMPVTKDLEKIQENFALVARTLNGISDNIALNYQNNYASSGVETGMGGKVMGAYFERLVE
jgi:hypothetical protein